MATTSTPQPHSVKPRRPSTVCTPSCSKLKRRSTRRPESVTSSQSFWPRAKVSGGLPVESSMDRLWTVTHLINRQSCHCRLSSSRSGPRRTGRCRISVISSVSSRRPPEWLRSRKPRRMPKLLFLKVSQPQSPSLEATLIYLEQHRILNEANTLQKQEYANLDQQFRQLQGVLNQAQNERKSVRPGLSKVVITSTHHPRRKNRLPGNKPKSIVCATTLQTSAQRRNSGRRVALSPLYRLQADSRAE